MIEPAGRSRKPVALEIAGAQPVHAPGADVLALGFGVTVAMWAVGYFCRLPRSLDADRPLQALVPEWLLLVLMLGCIVAAGYLAGRYTRRGIKGGLYVGLLSAALNLMVLGSLLKDPQAARVLHNPMIWVPGSLVFCALLGALGAAIGATRPYRGRPIHWIGVFTKVAVAGGALLLMAGGLVTSQGAGLAVVDWPRTEGEWMFLYPLSRMTGGIYYEHAHRLFGSLVGFTTLVLAGYLLLFDRRRSVRWLVVLALLAVIVQGILGGLRVTGRFTTTTDPAQVNPSTALAVVHGVFGQIVFALLAALAVVTSTTWYATTPTVDSPGRSTDRFLLRTMLPLLLVQLTIGTLQRHGMHQPELAWIARYTLITHISLGTILVAWGAVAGTRAWGLYEDLKAQARLGLTLVGLSLLQLLLGLSSLVVTGLRHGPAQPTPPAYDVIVTTLHQTVGAWMLACAVCLALWIRRQPAYPALPPDAHHG